MVNLGLSQMTKMLEKNIPIIQSPSICLVFVNIRKLLGWVSVGPSVRIWEITVISKGSNAPLPCFCFVLLLFFSPSCFLLSPLE